MQKLHYALINSSTYYNIDNLFSCIAFHPNGHLIATAQTSGKSSLAVQQQSHVQVHLTIVYLHRFPKTKTKFLVISKIVEYAVTQIQRLSIKCICHAMPKQNVGHD